MKGSFYLQLAQGQRVWVKDKGDGEPGYVPTVRAVSLTQNKPTVARGRLLVRITVELPDDAFTTFIPEATVVLEGPQLASIQASAEDMPEAESPDHDYGWDAPEDVGAK